MKKIVFAFISILLFAFSVSAQQADLLAKKGDKGLYLEHKVAPKESFFALGRMYNVSAKLLAAYNKLDLSKGLQIDQKIKVPLSDTNFTQTGNSGAPIYYKVAEKEGLVSVSKNNNGVKLAKLREWNSLTSDELKAGKKLVIGFLLGSTFKSVVMEKKTSPTELPPPPEQKDITEEKQVEKLKTKPEEPKVEQKNVEIKEVALPKVIKETPVTKSSETVSNNSTPQGEGYFHRDYEKQIKLTPISYNETVTAGIFKTTSGWQDAKFYLLIDKVTPGTIVKIINPSNNKAVYAKVLGEMSGIRQNIGLNIRLSNAGANVLGIKEEDKFVVKISY